MFALFASTVCLSVGIQAMELDIPVRRHRQRALPDSSAGMTLAEETAEVTGAYTESLGTSCGGTGGTCTWNYPITWGNGTSCTACGSSKHYDDGVTSANPCKTRCDANRDCDGFNYEASTQRCYYRSVRDGGVTCSSSSNSGRVCYQKNIKAPADYGANKATWRIWFPSTFCKENNGTWWTKWASSGCTSGYNDYAACASRCANSPFMTFTMKGCGCRCDASCNTPYPNGYPTSLGNNVYKNVR